MNIFKKKQSSKIEEVHSMEELFMNQPVYKIKDKKPFFTKGKSFLQCVFLSKVVGTKAVWMELDGLGRIRTETRAYRVPKQNIYGDVFIYDMDKKQCINELISVDKEDEEDSHKELQTANMYYMLGKLAGLNDFFGKLGNIMLLLIGCILASAVAALLCYTIFTRTTEIISLLHQIINNMPIKEIVENTPAVKVG
jgi:hypothetical protein